MRYCKMKGFVSIDSASPQREYVIGIEIWLLKRMETELPYEIKCPALLICGTKDHAGSCIRYNKAWHKKTGIPIQWIKGAGHNSNTDEPEMEGSGSFSNHYSNH